MAVIPCDIVIGPPGPPEVAAEGLGGLSGEPPAPAAVYVDVLPALTMEIPDLNTLVLPVAGPPGPSGGGAECEDCEYTHVQVSAAATWTVVHNLNTYPDMVLFVSDDLTERVYTDVTYPNPNMAVVTWPFPVSGMAVAR